LHSPQSNEVLISGQNRREVEINLSLELRSPPK
jgi:hypothetical protein